jgi:hypothetical protein
MEATGSVSLHFLIWIVVDSKYCEEQEVDELCGVLHRVNF